MIEKPALPDTTILATVEQAYHLSAIDLAFLPLGADARAGVYRLTASDNTRYFLKLKQGVLNESALFIPHYLKQQGITQVVAPLPTVHQTLWQRVEDFSLILYPYIEGRSGWDGGLSHVQWRQLGQLLRQLHAVQLPPTLAEQLMVERFVPDWIEEVKTQSALQQANLRDPIAQEMATFWQTKTELIQHLAARAEKLGTTLRQRSLPCVPCHADIHAADLMIDTEARLWVVDWDQVMLAPKERDLMFVIGAAVLGPIGDDNEAAFRQGYGACEIDRQALAYYRYAWAVQDIGSFADEVFGRPDLGTAAKAQALHYFKNLFDPGMIVEAAIRSKI